MLHPSLHPQHATQDRQPYFKRCRPCIRQEEEIGQQKVIPAFNIKRWTSSRTVWGHRDWLEWHMWHVNPNWLLSRPQQWLLQQNVRNWLISRPLCFTLKIDSFQDPASAMHTAKCHKLTPFKTLTFYIGNWLISRPLAFSNTHQWKRHPRQWTVSNTT